MGVSSGSGNRIHCMDACINRNEIYNMLKIIIYNIYFNNTRQYFDASLKWYFRQRILFVSLFNNSMIGMNSEAR